MGSITLAEGATYIEDGGGTVTSITSGDVNRITVTGTTTPVISAPDTPVYVGITLTNGTIVTAPSNATDITNKQYVDDAVSGGGLGTVLSFSFNDANGFTGTVTNPTSTPELTLSFDTSGLVPYTGATGNVNLGANSLTVDSLNVSGLSVSKLVGTDGSKDIVNYTLVQGSGIGISQVGTDITISSTLPSLVWNDISTTSQAITAGNGYVSHSASQTTFTLPATASFGSSFSILYLAPSSGQLLQNAGQTIIAGDSQTTSGTSGRIDNIDYGDVLTVLCTAANTEFMVISPIGNFNVV